MLKKKSSRKFQVKLRHCLIQCHLSTILLLSVRCLSPCDSKIRFELGLENVAFFRCLRRLLTFSSGSSSCFYISHQFSKSYMRRSVLHSSQIPQTSSFTCFETSNRFFPQLFVTFSTAFEKNMHLISRLWSCSREVWHCQKMKNQH